MLFSVFHLVIPVSGVKLGCSAVVPAGILTAGPTNLVLPYNVFLIVSAAPLLFCIKLDVIVMSSSSSFPVDFRSKFESLTVVCIVLLSTKMSSTSNPLICNSAELTSPEIVPGVIMFITLFVGCAVILVALLVEYTPLK